jgi:hypothetical protein
MNHSKERHRQFIYDQQTLIKRDSLKPEKTVLLILLHQDEQEARAQLLFCWKGITQYIFVGGVIHHPINKIEIRRLVTASGGGYPPLHYYQKGVGKDDVKTQIESLENCLGEKTKKIENIIVNCVGTMPFGLEPLVRKILPREKLGETMNVYHINMIEKSLGKR